VLLKFYCFGMFFMYVLLDMWFEMDVRVFGVEGK
jgi:hypothetical protein